MSATPSNPHAPVTVEEFLESFPVFVSIPSGAVRFQVELANMEQSQSAWGLYWRYAVMLSVAHALATLYDISAAADKEGLLDPNDAGVATSVSAGHGSLSIGSSAPAWMTGDDVLDSEYGRTWWGRQYLMLLIKHIPAGRVVISPQIGSGMGGEYGPGRRSRT